MASLYTKRSLSEIWAIERRGGFLINVYNEAVRTSKTVNAQGLQWIFPWSGVQKGRGKRSWALKG